MWFGGLGVRGLSKKSGHLLLYASMDTKIKVRLRGLKLVRASLRSGGFWILACT
jgi:hypothetical protein